MAIRANEFFLRRSRIRKGIVVLLVVTTAAILARGEILLLHEGGRLGFKQGDSIGQDGGGGAHSAENW